MSIFEKVFVIAVFVGVFVGLAALPFLLGGN